MLTRSLGAARVPSLQISAATGADAEPGEAGFSSGSGGAARRRKGEAWSAAACTIH